MSNTIWTVERIQLFFYNGCDNRWVMFQERPSDADDTPTISPDSFFRDQITRLLKTIRDALRVKVSHESSPPEARRVCIRTEPEELRQSASVTLASVDGPLRIDFVKYCRKALQREGVKDNGLETALTDLEGGRTATIRNLATASNFLSVLPIAHDWDVIGWLKPMSTGRDRFMPEDFWWRFFVYRVAFENRDPNAEDKKDPPEHQPLPYNVFLQMEANGPKKGKCFDGEEFEVDPDPTNPCPMKPEISYFLFAKSPTRERTRRPRQPRMSDEEFKAYLAYANVIDDLQKATSGTSQSQNDNERKETYYVVYPVIACGYYHFFQMQVRPTNGGSHVVTLQDCYNLFEKLPQKDFSETAVLKESLRELLVQIRLSAFQHYVTQWMNDKRNDILRDPKPDECAVRCFCELAPILNEMRVVATRDRAWAHVGPPDESSKVVKILRPWAETFAVDRNEQRKVTKVHLKDAESLEEEKFRVESIKSENIDMWLFEKSQESPFNEECFAGTNARRLTEQFEMVRHRMRRFWYAGRP